MASASQARLEAAFQAVAEACGRLETAAGKAAEQQSASGAEFEAKLVQATSENKFLKEDNQRLGNQLQALQKDFLELQKAALSTVNQLDASVKQIDLLLEH